MSSNGTTENNSRRCDDSHPQTQPFSMEQIPSDSKLYGIEPLSISGEDRGTENSDWKLTPIRDTTAGKILERLEVLEARYLEYVDSHQARLKARLEESKEDKQDFLQESNQIKSDIYHLAIAQQKADGNGHIN
jgi:hypothetical protein